MQRLRRRRDIQRVFREGRRAQAGALLLHARRREADEPVPGGARLAVIAARKFPSAVARNRARRIIREACRVLLKDAGEPWDLAVVVRTEALEQGYRERSADVAEMLRRATVLAEPTAAVQ